MSHRRRDARTDETTLSQGLQRNVDLESIAGFAEFTGLPIDKIIQDAKSQAMEKYEDEQMLKRSLQNVKSPLDILRRTISVRSVLSTNSSFAERMEALRDADPATLKLAEIGRGSFGTVFEIPGTVWCLKKTLTIPQPLIKEYNVGREVHKKFDNARLDIFESMEFPGFLLPKVPRYLCLYGTEDLQDPKEWFRKFGYLFPPENGGQKPGPLLCMERILPLPKVIRQALIQHYFDPDEQAEALLNPDNKSCLCRVYLGSVASEADPDKLKRARQTLKNFPLYLDQLIELDMDPLLIAHDMAMGLAVAHWSARINMLDVEFVIGSRATTESMDSRPPEVMEAGAAGSSRQTKSKGGKQQPSQAQPVQEKRRTFRNRAIQLWMIDFNKVDKVDIDLVNYEESIQNLVYQTRSTDGPYYPRVLARTAFEWNLWMEFAETYIKTSKVLIKELIPRANEFFAFRSEEEKKLLFARPSKIMNAWMDAEAGEYNVKIKEFLAKAKKDGWRMP
ncbi:hypothetical protein B0I35DRAFT_501048 [Stachybotrys elegans]|uniref:DUF3669 domain-containing protein n=1 Tax=Stachybotrys elegans TaxID=80388 RepID=A0A8K0SUA4_9HYPO|nr:hypothetical protein B0I35DRAFT_501048 [Stachybotrys elegans]